MSPARDGSGMWDQPPGQRPRGRFTRPLDITRPESGTTMKRLDARPFVLPSLGLLGWALLVGCHAEAPPTVAPTPSPASAPMVAASEPEGRQAVDQGTDRKVEKAEKVAGAVVPATNPAPPASDAAPPLTGPVVDAARTQVNDAVGELGRGVQPVTDEAAAGARQKADGLEQNLRQATDDPGKKAQGPVDQGLKRAKDAVQEVVPPPNPTPTR